MVNTASFVAVMGAATSQISYTASKGGVLALSRELGVEFGRRGVRVNALCPGPVNTPLLQELFAKDPEKAARRLVHLPMGRFAEAAEIAAAACFLASDDASYITASTFLVDGGLSGAYVPRDDVDVSSRSLDRHLDGLAPGHGVDALDRLLQGEPVGDQVGHRDGPEAISSRACRLWSGLEPLAPTMPTSR